MKIKVLRESGEELLLDTTCDAVAMLLSDKERQALADVAKIQNTMLQVPYRRIQPHIPGGKDQTWWQLWATRDWGDHLERGKNNDARPFIEPIRAAEAGA